MMFVSTTATYKTSNTFLPTPEHTSSHHRSAVSHEFTSPLSRVTRVHIIAQPCHTSSHHRSAVSHEFTSSLNHVTRVHITVQPCSLFVLYLVDHCLFVPSGLVMIVAVLGITSSDFPYMSSKLFLNYNSTPNSQLGMFDLQFTWYLYILSCLAVLVDTI